MTGKSVKNVLKRIEASVDELAFTMEKTRFREYLEYAADTKRLMKNSLLAGFARGIGSGIGFTLMVALLIYFLQLLAKSNLPIIADFIAELLDIVESRR